MRAYGLSTCTEGLNVAWPATVGLWDVGKSHVVEDQKNAGSVLRQTRYERVIKLR